VRGAGGTVNVGQGACRAPRWLSCAKVGWMCVWHPAS